MRGSKLPLGHWCCAIAEGRETCHLLGLFNENLRLLRLSLPVPRQHVLTLELPGNQDSKDGEHSGQR